MEAINVVWLKRGYDDIRCSVDASKLDAWKEGQTGIPESPA